MIPFLLTPGHDIQPTVLELPDQARSFSKPVLSFTSQMLLATFPSTEGISAVPLTFRKSGHYPSWGKCCSFKESHSTTQVEATFDLSAL